MGRTARTAACFCVVLTLETPTFLAAVLRATGFGAAFFVLTAGLAFADVFLDARALAALRASGLAAVALLALGLDGDFALTARFVLFAAGLTFERDADRLKPFVRLLLMGGISKGCSPEASSRELPASLPQTRLYINGDKYLRVLYQPKIPPKFREMCQQRKTLDGHCWPMLKCFRLTEA